MKNYSVFRLNFRHIFGRNVGVMFSVQKWDTCYICWVYMSLNCLHNLTILVPRGSVRATRHKKVTSDGWTGIHSDTRCLDLVYQTVEVRPTVFEWRRTANGMTGLVLHNFHICALQVVCIFLFLNRPLFNICWATHNRKYSIYVLYREVYAMFPFL